MFGCCVAGRLLQTNLQQVDETHALFEIPAAEKVNHVCVFLLGTVAFPDGYGATVHFFWPGKGSQVLGMLSNEKPSAIFRLRSNFSSISNPASGMSTPSAFTSAASTTTGEITAILGFAVEPLEAVAAQIAALPSNAINNALGSSNAMSVTPTSGPSSLVKPADPSALAEKIAKHLFHYVSGFVPAGGRGVGPDSVVPMSVIARWYESFMSKLKAGGVGFLERED
ncbi:hypothetical protein HYDPIDRAFT_99801 [Hydnomerulius pinastri MD-312]|uniref:Hikeshi-like domain-containing protein n=1 Tax=Hydnomerulius pinastri MD-312 TaxID=994086 RepID=A0A0C9W9Z6_9AGAM|nr:hypothetical protein HYDPIDRAFT_99801 [Hydnomerulius pinastri MD-312]